MTTEIVEYKCPSCGHLLGEEEFSHACRTNKKLVDEKVEQQLQQQLEQIKNGYAKKIQEINEKNELEKEREVRNKVAKVVSAERTWMELKHKKELEEAQKQNTDKLDEKIKEAITSHEANYIQKVKEFEMQIKRIESHNRELLAEVEKQKKILDSVPSELKGTSGEFILIDELKEEFRTDDIVGKKVGVAMADVVQYIVTETGERVPIPIVYDKKMGKLVTPSDLVKAKNYKMIHNTNHCLIVTEDIKRNDLKRSRSKFSEEREGVLLVHPLAIVDIAKRIRSFLIENTKQTKNNNGRDSKQSKLYDYLTSAEYSRDMQIILEAKSKLDELQRKEEDYHRTTWSKRKDFIEKWFDVDHKNDRIIDDITQEDQSSDADKKASNEDDGENPSS